MHGHRYAQRAYIEIAANFAVKNTTKKARAKVKDNRGGKRIATVAIGDKHKERERGQHGGARHDDIHIRTPAQVIQDAGGKGAHNQQQARPVAQVDGAGGMRSRKAGIESREHAGEAGGRHRQTHHGTLEGCLCLGVIEPPGATFKRIDRQLGNLGLELGRRLIAQFSSAGTVKQPNQCNRTGDEDKLLGNARRHHHMVEHLYQNARSIRNRHGARQTGRLRKTPRQIGMGGRPAIAQRTARHQAAGNYHLNLNRHNQQQQCRHQQNARDVARRVDGMGTTIIQNGAHKKANHARAEDKALINNDLVRRHELGHAHIKEILARQKREGEQRQAYNLPNAPTQICGCVSHAPHG